MSALLLKNTRLPGGDTADILMENGVITRIERGVAHGGACVDAGGLPAFPGLVDIHCHLRDPGFTHKEDIASGRRAAAAGGFTDICCMPNTAPALDSPAHITYVLEQSSGPGARVHPIAAATRALAGEQLTDFAALFQAGAVAVSDDGRPISGNALMKCALVLAARHGKTLISHCEMLDLSEGGAVNEGEVSAALGVRGIPNSAEDLMIARDIILAEEAGARVHIAHVSTAAGVRMVREAKARGVLVTAETCPHYFALTERAVLTRGTNAKMSPPLRTERDRQAVLEGIADGTIDAVVTDHAPHSADEKALPLDRAPNGIVGFETALALGITHLVKGGVIPLERLVALMTTGPARCIGLRKDALRVGARADVVVFDPDRQFTVDAGSFYSKSKNTPFDGEKLCGQIKYTVAGGRLVHGEGEA